IDLKGKIALVLKNSPGYNNPHDNPFAQYENPRRKANMVKEAGAIGMIIIAGPNHGEDELGRLRVSNDKIEIPVISAKRSLFDMLFSENNKDLAKIQADIDSLKVSNSFAFTDANTKAKIQTDLKFITAYTNNLIGLIEGNDPTLKNETIVIGAHMDHLGDGMKYGSLYDKHEPAIHNGADDNASGCAGVMELAEYFASNKKGLKRSVIFMTFSAEEAGLIGSAYFTKSELFKKYNIVSMINLDMVGRLADNKLTVGGTGTSSIWDKMIDSLNGIANFNLTKNTDGFGPSDHSSFYGKEVPVLFFFTSLHSDYHRPSDDWDKINAEGEVKVLNMVANVVECLNNLALKPDYIKTKEQTSENRNMGFRVTLGIIPDYSSSSEGLAITGVKAGSAGENAGLQAGDIIKKMGDFEIKNIYDYTDALSKFKPGEETVLIVKRGNDELTLNITFKK
ncbi:MAG TPA: M20/M25/M40 family metallo-hydrolase, partial [Ignavibacteria bacterium]